MNSYLRFWTWRKPHASNANYDLAVIDAGRRSSSVTEDSPNVDDAALLVRLVCMGFHENLESELGQNRRGPMLSMYVHGELEQLGDGYCRVGS